MSVASTDSRRRWAALTPTERVAERRELLVQAGFDILGNDGWRAMTIRSVIERANLNVRYFYESFRTLDELSVAVYDSVVDEMARVIVSTLERAKSGPADQVKAMVTAIIRFVDEDRRRGQVLYVEGLGSEALNRRRLEAGQSVVAFIEQYASEAEGRPEREEGIGRVAASIVVGGFSQVLVDWLAGRIRMSKAALADEVSELFLAVGDAASVRAELGGIAQS